MDTKAEPVENHKNVWHILRTADILLILDFCNCRAHINKSKKRKYQPESTVSIFRLRRFEVLPNNTEVNYLLLLWLSMPIILPFMLSYIFPPIYTIKHTIVASMAFYLLVASGIGSLRKFPIKVLVIGLIIALNLLHSRTCYGSVRNVHWKAVAQYVDKNAH